MRPAILLFFSVLTASGEISSFNTQDASAEEGDLEDPVSLLQLQRDAAGGDIVVEAARPSEPQSSDILALSSLQASVSLVQRDAASGELPAKAARPGPQTKDILELASVHAAGCKEGCRDSYRQSGRITTAHDTVLGQVFSSAASSVDLEKSLSNASKKELTERSHSNASKKELHEKHVDAEKKHAGLPKKKHSGVEQKTAWHAWMKKYGDVDNMKATLMNQSLLPPRSRHINAETVAADWLREYPVEGARSHPVAAPVAEPKQYKPMAVAIIALLVSSLILATLHFAS